MSTQPTHVTTFPDVIAHLKTQGYIRHLQQTGHEDIAKQIHDGILTKDEAQRILNGKQSWQLTEPRMMEA